MHAFKTVHKRSITRQISGKTTRTVIAIAERWGRWGEREREIINLSMKMVITINV